MRSLRRRLIIIEQNEKLKVLMSSLIDYSNRYFLVNMYSELNEAHKNLDDDYPDIILLNVDHACASALEFIGAVRKKSEIYILALSAFSDTEKIFSVLSAGANGYLLLDNFLTTMIKHLDDVSEGGAPLDPIVAKNIVNEMHVTKGSPISARETQVLRLMIQGNTYIKIADNLNISAETAKTHIKNIYRKLNVNSRSEAVRIAVEDRLVAKLQFDVGIGPRSGRVTGNFTYT